MKDVEVPAASAVTQTTAADGQSLSFIQRAVAIRASQVTDADIVWYGDLVLWVASETELPLRRTADEVAGEWRKIPIYRRRQHDAPMLVTSSVTFDDPSPPVRYRRMLYPGIGEPQVVAPTLPQRPRLSVFDWLPVLKEAIDFEGALKLPEHGNAFGIRLIDAVRVFGYPCPAETTSAIERVATRPGNFTSQFQPALQLPDDASLYEEWKRLPARRTETLAEKYNVDRSTINRRIKRFRDAKEASRRDQERDLAIHNGSLFRRAK